MNFNNKSNTPFSILFFIVNCIYQQKRAKSCPKIFPQFGIKVQRKMLLHIWEIVFFFFILFFGRMYKRIAFEKASTLVCISDVI